MVFWQVFLACWTAIKTMAQTVAVSVSKMTSHSKQEFVKGPIEVHMAYQEKSFIPQLPWAACKAIKMMCAYMTENA